MTTNNANGAPGTIKHLQAAGQSIWLDFIRRSFIESGDLERYVRQGWITGLTSNPSIFAKAIGGSTDYDQAIQEMSERGVSDPYEAFVELAVEDIQNAADIFLPTYESTDKADGFISLETPPGIESDTDATVAEALRLSALVDRPNVMIKVPGTDAGIEALERLIAQGVNVNVTLIFTISVYDRVARAYVRGVESFVDAGGDPSKVSSVASFFVSRIDTAVDAVLGEGHQLNGQIAIANAREAYRSFSQIQQDEQWQRLAKLRARPQRLLWASTSAKNPAFSDVLYVDELVMAQTVNTMPEATLRAFADHGDGTSRDGTALIDGARSTLTKALEAGVDLEAIGSGLLAAGLDSFASDFAGLLDTVRGSLAQPPAAQPDLSLLGSELAAKVTARLGKIADEDQIRRIWHKDHTLWAEDPTEISDRLGWLTVHEMMVDNIDDLTGFAEDTIADGFTSVALLGMGGSSLAPEVLALSLSPADADIKLYVLDTTDPAAITAFEESVDLDHTLFIAASKSGTTIETRSQLEYFWNKLPNSRQYVVITDRGSELVEIGRERNFRRVFINQPDIGGRYSALSYFGLVPAALVGVDIAGLLDNATSMTCALDGCVPVDKNPGAVLGAVLAEAALAGRDKATILAPEGIASFGTWAEQLIAESTGKEGRGIVPVESERTGAPSVYGNDRLFIAIGEHDGIDALINAGHPVFKIPFEGSLQLGSEFLKWEMAVAVAGAILGINPFDQPNVQEAKDLTSEVLGGSDFDDSTPSGPDILAKVSPGDYVAFLAYIPRNAANEERLAGVRHAIRDRFGVATTVGFGPRFLHSTGQLHKGGPDTGVFFQIVGDDGADIPIPGQVFSFGVLKHAQALGDLQALKSRGRRVARVTIEQLEEMTR